MLTRQKIFLKQFRFAIPAMLCAMASSALTEYQLPSYPQQQGALRAIAAHIPTQVPLGAKASISFDLTLGKPLPDHRLFVYLLKDNKVYHVEVLEPASKDLGAGTRKAGPFTLAIPSDISSGDYKFRAGMYGEKLVSEGEIKLIGEPSGRRRMIITTGCFVDKYGTPHYWHINKAHTLIWDGKPFMPAGGMFIYDRDWNLVKAQLDLLKHYGVKNIYLHLGVNQPYVWKNYSDDDYRFFQKTIDYLDDNGFTYGIEFQALEAKGFGYQYAGGGVGVDHVKSSGTVRAETKQPRSGVFIVCDNATGKILQRGAARVAGGKFLEADVVVPKVGDYRVAFSADREAPDNYVMYYWDDKYDTYVKKVQSHYSKVRLGSGFRFLADPLWNEMNNNHSFIPSAPRFAEEFTQWLKQRYGTVDKLNAAWKPVGERWPSFEAAGSTFSIERIDDKTTGKLMQYAYSRSARMFFAMVACESQFNYDVREFIGRSLLHYCNDIADVFKKMNDVPVIYKAFTDIDWWHINDTGLASGHDGLGMESYGNGEPLLLFMGAHIFGECEQATKTTWLIVTETGEGNHQDAVLSRNKSIGYTDRLRTMYANYNALISGGAKGVYQFNMIGGRGMQDPWSDNLSRDPRQLEWLATYDRILGSAKKLVDYKPPAYYRFPGHFNPCSMELYSEPCGDFYNMGGWWWREPIERAQNGVWILPSFSLRPDSPMLIVNLEKMPATARYTGELSEAVKAGDRITMIGFRKDLGALPAVDSYYTDRFSINERGRKFQVLKLTPTSQILGKTAVGEVWNLIDGKLQINSEEVFGQHGYSPENLAFGAEKPIDPYDGVFDLMGVKMLDLGPNLAGLAYDDGGVPVTVITARKDKCTLTFPRSAGAEYRYPNGQPAGIPYEQRIKVDLEPVSPALVKAKYDWGPDGILIDSLNTKETVIIRGLDLNHCVPEEAVADVKREVLSKADQLKGKDREQRLAEISAFEAKDFPRAQREIEAVNTVEEKFYSSQTPYIWIEGEKPVSHNFNYAMFGAVPTLSGNGFLALETAVQPPKDTGWYATYQFEAPKSGAYQLWLRENYLSYSSPSSYRVDDGKWMLAPNTLVPLDTEVVTLYNAVEDERQIFAWYHYGAVDLSAGRHTITFRVDKPRPKGTVLTMADDRPFAKQINCIILTQRGFKPDGKNRPHYLLDEVSPPMVNLLPNPSVEFDSDNDGKCDGWKPSEETGLEWTKPGWGNIKLDGLFDMNCGMKDAYAEMRALKITGGDRDRAWSSDPVKMGNENKFLLSAWVRTSERDTHAFVGVRFMDGVGRWLRSTYVSASSNTREWQQVIGSVTKPEGAVAVVFDCLVAHGSKGTAWFDDMVLASVPVGATPRAR